MLASPMHDWGLQFKNLRIKYGTGNSPGMGILHLQMRTPEAVMIQRTIFHCCIQNSSQSSIYFRSQLKLCWNSWIPVHLGSFLICFLHYQLNVKMYFHQFLSHFIFCIKAVSARHHTTAVWSFFFSNSRPSSVYGCWQKCFWRVWSATWNEPKPAILMKICKL